MALIRGVLLSFDDPLLGVFPTVVPFQYNPAEIQRVFRSEAGAAPGKRSGAALNAAIPPEEAYSLKLELDATDGLEHGGPITLTNGIAPRLAALEMLTQPVGKSLLSGLLVGGRLPVPAGKLRLVLFSWGPFRITPVRITDLTIRETAFDALLNPIHATADLGLQVLRLADLGEDERFARAAAKAYQGAREVRAALNVPQGPELIPR
jgi:hypothetical protein